MQSKYVPKYVPSMYQKCASILVGPTFPSLGTHLQFQNLFVGLEFPDGSSSVNPLSQTLAVLSEVSLELDVGDPRSAQVSLLLSELQLESAKIPMLQFERDEEEVEKREAKLTALKVSKIGLCKFLYRMLSYLLAGTVGPFTKQPHP